MSTMDTNTKDSAAQESTPLLQGILAVMARDAKASDYLSRRRKGQWLFRPTVKKPRIERPMIECPECEGAGVIAVMIRDSYLGMKERFEPCENCGESGRVHSDDQ